MISYKSLLLMAGLSANRPPSVTVSEGEKEAIYRYSLQKPPGKDQLYHEPVSPEQNQKTGRLAQSVMLQLPHITQQDSRACPT